MENEGPSYYVEASSPFTFWENYSWAPKPLLTLVSIPVIILELTHIWKSKKNPRNILHWIRCLWPESQSGMQRKKQSFGDKVKGIMPRNCAMNKTNQKHRKEKKKITPTREAACLKEPCNSELPMIAQLSLNIAVTCTAKTYKHAGISWKKFQGSVVNINHDLTHLHLTVPKAVHGITTGHSPVSFLVGYVSIRGLEMQSQYIP